MTIEISKESRSDAVESIKRYIREDLEDNIGDLAANGLLDYFLRELGPIAYNKAAADVQERLQVKITDLNGEIFEDEFQFWRKHDRK
ncbi:MAG: DUF2164 domain-containing protein [Betaproteobacteria bacterium]